MRLVPRAGVEPAPSFEERILSPQRLPFRHPGTAVKIAWPHNVAKYAWQFSLTISHSRFFPKVSRFAA